jgi:hypothetical protein
MAEVMLAIGVASSAYSAYATREQAQSEKASLRKQEAFQKKELLKSKERTLAQQKVSFLSSGISLFGGIEDSTGVFFQETETASAEDLMRMEDYYAANTKTLRNKERAGYMQSLGQAASSVYSYGGAK